MKGLIKFENINCNYVEECEFDALFNSDLVTKFFEAFEAENNNEIYNSMNALNLDNNYHPILSFLANKNVNFTNRIKEKDTDYLFEEVQYVNINLNESKDCNYFKINIEFNGKNYEYVSVSYRQFLE